MTGTKLRHRLKELINFDVDWDDLEYLDKPCPGCGRNTLYYEDGWLIGIERCRECRCEGGVIAKRYEQPKTK